jgi:hypothetical protein
MSKKDASNRASPETITPLSVPGVKKGIDKGKLQRRHHISILILLGSVTILIAIGAWFLHYLAKNPLRPPQITEKQTAPKSAAEKKSAGRPAKPLAPAEDAKQLETALPPTEDPEQLAIDRQNAEQKLADYLETKNELEGKGADEWGQEAYTEMTEFGREADSLFINEDYKSAAAKYERATIVGRGTIDQMDEALARLLDEGRNALTEGDGVVARSKFSLAMMIDPSNQSARYGFKRAQTIETVLQLIESGRQHEKDDMLSQARDDYQAALQIDSDFEEARRALNRVSGLIKEKQFTELMSAGLTAFHNNDYALARTKLQQAKSLNPGSREVSDALLQVNQALRLARIDRLREEANKAEQSEDWPKALKFYLAVLEMDKNLQFAARGEKRAREQISIAGRLDFFLSQPQVLESDQQLKNAVLLMHEAREVEPRSRKLTARLKELEELIQIAQTPVVITIESDNLTQVAVYKVGKLGRFSQRKLKLRPGTYTVVGARDGYQDVRQKIIVKAGQQALRVTVKCRVKI